MDGISNELPFQSMIPNSRLIILRQKKTKILQPNIRRFSSSYSSNMAKNCHTVSGADLGFSPGQIFKKLNDLLFRLTKLVFRALTEHYKTLFRQKKVPSRRLI